MEPNLLILINNNNEGEEKSPIESLCDLKYIQDEYNIIKESVMRHQYLENLNLEDKQHQHEQQQRQKEEMISRLNNLPIFRKDPWDYYYDINHNLVTNDRWYVKLKKLLYKVFYFCFNYIYRYS